MVLRWDGFERVLRSVGDPPNGILGVATPDATATFVIDPTYQPPAGARGIQSKRTETGIDDTAFPVSVSDVIDGCASPVELTFVVQAACGTLAACVHYFVQTDSWNLDLLQSHVDLLREIEREMQERLDA